MTPDTRYSVRYKFSQLSPNGITCPFDRINLDHKLKDDHAN